MSGKIASKNCEEQKDLREDAIRKNIAWLIHRMDVIARWPYGPTAFSDYVIGVLCEDLAEWCSFLEENLNGNGKKS